VFVDNKKEGLVSELGPRVSGVWLLDWLVCWLRQMNMKNNENTHNQQLGRETTSTS